MIRLRNRHNMFRSAVCTPFVLALLLMSVKGEGQATEKSAYELVESLTKGGQQWQAGISLRISCGETNDIRQRRALARELVSKGKSAISDLELVLGSLDQEGQSSRFFSAAGWFLLAYARIQGAAAIPRLTRMALNPELVSLRPTLDKAIALSLGLTSYLSGSTGPVLNLDCRRQEPRDALDQLIQALEYGDLSQLESSLGPDALKALGQMEAGRSWNLVYRAIWPQSLTGAVGYLFEIPGRWSEPDETLEEKGDYRGAPLTAEKVELVTRFRNGAGRDCGKYTVEFHRENRRNGAIYQVDNPDLADLVRLLGACRAQ